MTSWLSTENDKCFDCGIHVDTVKDRDAFKIGHILVGICRCATCRQSYSVPEHDRPRNARHGEVLDSLWALAELVKPQKISSRSDMIVFNRAQTTPCNVAHYVRGIHKEIDDLFEYSTQLRQKVETVERAADKLSECTATLRCRLAPKKASRAPIRMKRQKKTGHDPIATKDLFSPELEDKRPNGR